MRKLVFSFLMICIVSGLGVSEADSARRSHKPPVFDVPTHKRLSKGCSWGCFYWGYIGEREHNVVISKGRLGKKPFHIFYLKNMGPHALTLMSVFPSHYMVSGCPPIFGKLCSHIVRLEGGKKIVMGMIYGDAPDTVTYNFRFIDEAGKEKKFYQVLLSTLAVPTIVYRSSSRGREPSIKIIYNQGRKRK